MFTQDKANAVCALVAEGQSLRKACEAESIKAPTFLLWCSERESLAEQYARARALGNDAEFEALSELQDMAPQLGPSGSVDAGWVAWKRLQIDTKKWELSKKAPKKYGEKIEATHEAGESIQRIVREIVRAG
jgi:hypothetical protein